MSFQSSTLQYPPFTHEITNILLIDSSVRYYHVFVNSVNAQTLPIVYSPACSKRELLELLTANLTTISRMALVFETNGSHIFLDNNPLFVLQNVPSVDPLSGLTEMSVPFGENMDFLIDIIRQFQIQNIDFLACNTLNMPDWKPFYDVLGQSTNVIVGASNDATGNLQYGGDWTMETTGQDIELIYFTESIEYYKYLLGYNTLQFAIINNKGVLYSCGYNGNGQLGVGDGTLRNVLTAMTTTNITGLTPIYVTTGGSNRIIVLMSNGTVYGCGNTNGTLGSIVTTALILTRMTNAPSNIKTIVSGDGHTIFLLKDGTVYGCGNNTNGQLGNQTTTSTASPNNPVAMTMSTASSGTLTATQVCCNTHSTYILCTDNNIYACGNLSQGSGGNNTYTVTNSRLVLVPNSTTFTPKQIACGDVFLVVLMTNGTIWGTGVNVQGVLGLGNTTSKTTLTQMLTTSALGNANVPDGVVPSFINCNERQTFVLMNNKTVFCCGYNANGQLGLGNTTNQNKLIQTANGISGEICASISCQSASTYLLMQSGDVYSCGSNEYGQLGRGTGTGAGATVNSSWAKMTFYFGPVTSLSDVNYSVTGGGGYYGYLANLRIVVGTSVYDPTSTTIDVSKYQLTNIPNTKLLLIGDTYVDTSTAAHTIAQIDANDGGTINNANFPSDTIQNSFYFAGTNSLSISPTDISFGLADYTIEFWFNTASFAATIMPLGTLTTNGLNIRLISSTAIQVDSANVSNVTYTVPTMTVNTWINVIFVRKLQTGVYTHACFVNGIKNTANSFGTSLTTNFSGATTTIGSVSGFTYTGYLANIRLVVGTAVYDPASNDLISTFPKNILKNITNTKLLLRGDIFYDISPPSHTITNNSSIIITSSSLGYLLNTDIVNSYTFNGSNTITYTPLDLSFGLADFTIECCFKSASFGRTIIGTSTNNNGLSFDLSNSTTIEINSRSIGTISYTVPTMYTNTWYHLVVVRKLQAGNYTNAVFLNGLKHTNSVSYLTYNFSGVSNLIGGGRLSAFSGSLSNLRVVVGTAIYNPTSSSILPSFKKLTNVTNTKLLLLGDNFVDGSTPAHTVSAGAVTIATFIY